MASHFALSKLSLSESGKGGCYENWKEFCRVRLWLFVIWSWFSFQSSHSSCFSLLQTLKCIQVPWSLRLISLVRDFPIFHHSPLSILHSLFSCCPFAIIKLVVSLHDDSNIFQDGSIKKWHFLPFQKCQRPISPRNQMHFIQCIWAQQMKRRLRLDAFSKKVIILWMRVYRCLV